jgi:hypothetical protein
MINVSVHLDDAFLQHTMFMIAQDGRVPEFTKAQLDERQCDREVRLRVCRQCQVIVPLCQVEVLG